MLGSTKYQSRSGPGWNLWYM